MRSRGLIENMHPNMPLPKLAHTSSPEDWKKMGQTMLQAENYAQVSSTGTSKKISMLRTLKGHFLSGSRRASEREGYC
jgi:hypothetical protein